MSMQWQGISAIYDAEGQLLSDASVASASGVDWTQAVSPVPLPGTFVLMAAGLAVVAGRARVGRLRRAIQ